MIKSFLKNDLLYFFKSKQLLIFTTLITLIFGVTIFLNYSSAKKYYAGFQKNYIDSIENGLDVDEIMSMGYEIETSNDVTVLKNPLPYYYEKTIDSITALQPNSLIGTIYATVPFSAAFIISILGVVSVTEDIKNKTIKSYVIMYGKKIYILLKILATIIRVSFLLTISTLLAFMIDIPFVISLKQKIQIDIPNITIPIHSLITQIFFAFFIFITYSILGFLLATLLRNALIASLFFWIESLLPFNQKYLIDSIINSIVATIYNFNGNFATITGTVSLDVFSYILLVITPVVSILLSVLIFQKKSAYV